MRIDITNLNVVQVESICYFLRELEGVVDLKVSPSGIETFLGDSFDDDYVLSTVANTRTLSLVKSKFDHWYVLESNRFTLT